MKKTKRILALVCAALLILMYLITLVLAFLASPAAKGMLMAAIACTVVLPCLIYGILLIARILDNRQDEPEEKD